MVTSGSGGGRKGAREVIASPRPVLVIIGVAGCAALAFLWIVVPISDQGGYASFPGYMVVLAVSWIALVGGATTHIEVRGDELVLVDWMTIRTVHREAIDHITGDNGVVIVTRSGERLESTAYGRSVLQMVFPSARYARVATRMQEWVDAGGARAASGNSVELRESHATITHHRRVPLARHPRQILTRGLPIALVATQLLGVLLWWMSPVLLRIVVSL